MQLLANINYSLRLLRKTPGFTLATLIVLVLGLSLYLTSYTFVRILSDKPMPFVNGDRYVTLKTINNDIGSFDYSQDAYDQYAFNRLRDRSTSYTILGAFDTDSFVFSDRDYAQRFAGASVSTDLFTALEVNPSQGRVFNSADAEPGGERVAIISHSLWQSYYGGDPEIVGESSLVNGEPHTVIGVMPEDFKFPTHQDVWFPLHIADSATPGEGVRLTLVGILNEDSNLIEAEIELNALLQELSVEYPEIYANRSEIVRYYAASTSPDTNGFNQILLYTTLIILTLGVVNLSSLLLIRSASRRHELAIRSSLGANGWELAKQVLLESSLICTFGLVVSIGLTSLLLPLMQIQFQSSQEVPLPFWFDFQIDGNVVLAGILCTALIWLASSLFVAIRVCREKPAEALSASTTKGAGGTGKSWITQIVVSTEVTLSCFLLVCCGMVVYFAYQVTNTDYGLDTTQYVSASFNLAHPDYQRSADKINYLRNLEEQASQIPTITNIAFTSAIPGFAGQAGRYQIADRDLSVNDQLPLNRTIWIDENYLPLLGVNVLEGRNLDSGDNADSELVTLINEDLARELWPESSALGKQITSYVGDQERVLTVVGVIATVRQSASRLVPNPDVLYRPLSQDTPNEFYLTALVEPSPIELVEDSLRRIANNLDRNIPIENIQPLDIQISKIQGAFDVLANIFIVLAVGTLLLAIIGIYAVITRSVSERVQEIGICRALGSTNVQVITRFIKQGFRYLLLGIPLGVGPAILVVTFSFSAVGINEGMVVLPVLSVLVVLGIGALISWASFLPARKAIALEPGDALRYE